MSNAHLTAVTLVILSAHISALIASILRRRTGPLLAVNLLAAGFLLVAIALHPRRLVDPVDWQVLGLAAFELLAIAAALAARQHVRLAVPVSCAVFGMHFLASAGALAFVLTFKITRLI